MTAEDTRSTGDYMLWADNAACRGMDPNSFYPAVGNWVTPEIQAMCDACPVRLECLHYAVANHERGIWAGTSERQRSRMRRTLPPTRPSAVETMRWLDRALNDSARRKRQQRARNAKEGQR